MTQSSKNTDLKIPLHQESISVANHQSQSSSGKTVSQNQSSSLWQKTIGFWNNVPLKTKITSLLIVCATIPTIAVTQGIIEISKQDSLSNLQKSLETNLNILEAEIEEKTENLEGIANSLAIAVQGSNINPSLTKNNSSEQQKLQQLINSLQNQYLDNRVSFYFITDTQGKIVAQFVQTIKFDENNYPLLPTEKSSPTEFEAIQLPANSSLADVPIVSNTIKLSQPLHGFERLNRNIVQRLGLDKQANIGIRKQQIDGLPEAKKPYPEGTFEVDNGQAGFALMATQTIKLNNQNVGTVVIGTLLNRNFAIVDSLKADTGVSTATIFGQDWRVSTNVPYTDQKTRAIGTRVSREVADAVLNKKEVFLGKANIIGIEYLTGYSPMYDHQQQIDPEQAKPMGIAYVGEPLTEINESLKQISLVGYGIGGSVIFIFAIVLLITPSDTGISRQLAQLTEFAGKVASGKTKVRLKENQRQDEIGVLTRNLNEMAAKIDLNFEARQQELEKQKQEKEKLEQEIYQLLDDVQGALEGDLTVRANLNSMEMSTVADLFNAIIDNLNDIAIRVKESSSKVSSSLGENEESIQKLAKQAIKETEETRKTLDSVEQMYISIEEVADNANQAANFANEAYNVTQEGTKAIEETAQSIIGLRTTVGETAKKMKRLGESSQKISQVVSLIEEIALKTNLLAINASVEASRAGEQGEGFSIVAEQVGALAEQSAAATKEITKIVEAIQQETQEVTEAMELGTTQVVESTRLVEDTQTRLQQVLERSQRINELMQSISQATISQTDTSRSVTELMQEIAKLAEERLNASQEVAQSMQNNAQVAKQLELAVEQFKIS